MIQQRSAYAVGRRLRELAAVLRQRDIGRQVACVASYNIASTAAAGLGGIIIARTLGPELRGEYAAVTAWFGVALMIGGVGQPAALCFYVAHDPGNARGYVATSRAIMLVTGTAALAGGILLAPLLARGSAGLTLAYRIVFAISIVAFVGASYTFSLQAKNLRWWNEVRASQPVLSLAFLIVLWRLRLLTLTATLIVLALTLLLQLGWAYYRCRSADLVPGHAQARLVRPLARYGVSQIAALTPTALNANLDQLVLSQAVPSAALGRYAIAVSLSLLPIPLVSAIGNVAFPRLASRQRVDGLAARMQWLGILGAACGAAGTLLPLDLIAPWLVPRVFGPGYADVVPLLWILTPAGVFLACSQVTGDILRGRKCPLIVARAQGLAAVFTVILLVALLPVAGVYGAAIASAVAYGVALAVMLLSLRRLPPASYESRHRRRPADEYTAQKRSDDCRPPRSRRPQRLWQQLDSQCRLWIGGKPGLRPLRSRPALPRRRWPGRVSRTGALAVPGAGRPSVVAEPAGYVPPGGGVLDRNHGKMLTTSPEADDDRNAGGVGERRLGRTASSPSRITIFTRGYPPAHLFGGPARSLFALVEALAVDFRFSVITSAFDDPAAGPMRSVKPRQWNTLGHATIWYEPKYRISTWRTVTLLKETKPRLVYLNSFFDYRFTILPLLITRMTSRKTPVVLAPRGELSAGALALKWQKKRIFITAFRILRLHKAVTWHACTEREKTDIERVFGKAVRSHVAIDLRTGLLGVEEQYYERGPGTDPNCCSLVFFSRIVRKKNVATVIRAIPLVKSKIHLSIAGPIQDRKYWAECLKMIDNISDPEMIKYVGSISIDGAINFLSRFDLFVFPTLGENFGHVVLESLAAGTPVIVGNDTPWHQVEAFGAGWICDPASPEAVAELIERFLALDEGARMCMRTAARALARQVLNDPSSVDANRVMFQALTSSRSS